MRTATMTTTTARRQPKPVEDMEATYRARLAALDSDDNTDQARTQEIVSILESIGGRGIEDPLPLYAEQRAITARIADRRAARELAAAGLRTITCERERAVFEQEIEALRPRLQARGEKIRAALDVVRAALSEVGPEEIEHTDLVRRIRLHRQQYGTSPRLASVDEMLGLDAQVRPTLRRLPASGK